MLSRYTWITRKRLQRPLYSGYVGNDLCNDIDSSGKIVFSFGGLMTSNAQGSYKRLSQANRAHKRLKDIATKTCKVIGQTHFHHMRPRFTGNPSRTRRIDAFPHLSLLHPMFNIVMRLNDFPGTYGAQAQLYQGLLHKNLTAQREFAQAMMFTVKTVDASCKGMGGYKPLARPVRDAFKQVGWL